MKKYCRECGAQLNPDLDYCPQCGITLNELDIDKKHESIFSIAIEKYYELSFKQRLGLIIIGIILLIFLIWFILYGWDAFFYFIVFGWWIIGIIYAVSFDVENM